MYSQCLKAKDGLDFSILLKKVVDEWKINESELDEVIEIPKTLDFLNPILAVVPCQLLAYYCANLLSRDIDKPRNLAKSVTVE